MRLWLLFFLLPVAAWAQPDATASGYSYQQVVSGSGPQAQLGDIVLLSFEFLQEGKPVFSSRGKEPMAMLLDSAALGLGGITETLFSLRVGDSITIRQEGSKFYTNFLRQPTVRDSIAVVGGLKLEDAMTPAAFQAMLDRQKQEKMEKELSAIDAAIKEKGETTTRTTEGGTRVIIHQEGDGAVAAAGDTIAVHYTGTLMDGSKFDSSRDRGQPIEFPVGLGRVIPGWDESLVGMPVGTKATIYIPSTSGYGERGAPPVIPGNATLVFEVELVGIEGK